MIRRLLQVWRWRREPIARQRLRNLERRRRYLVHCRLTSSLVLLAEMDRQGVDVLRAHDRTIRLKRRMLERSVQHDQDFLAMTESRRRRGSPRPEWHHRGPGHQPTRPTLEGEHRIRPGYVRVER